MPDHEHPRQIRCPKCGHTTTICGPASEGRYETWCGRCSFQFWYGVRVVYVSPGRIDG